MIVVPGLLIWSPGVQALQIQIVGDPLILGGGNLEFSTSATRISLSDYYNQYSETRWEIESAENDANGGVRVSYAYSGFEGWDSYGAFVDATFRIVSDSGSSDPEPVTVEVSGASFLDLHSVRGCCFSDAPQVDAGPINFYPQGIYGNYEAGPYGYYDFRFINAGLIGGQYQLQTNTDYHLFYSINLYVEGHLEGELPRYFSSWDMYDDFVSLYGTSGRAFTSASGFMGFTMSLSPTSVPEPGTLALLSLGLAGLGFSRRKKLN